MKKQILKFGLVMLTLSVFQSCMQDIKLPVKEEINSENFEIQPSEGARLASTIKVMNLSKKWYKVGTSSHFASVDVNGDRIADLFIGGGGTFALQYFGGSDVLSSIEFEDDEEVKSLQLNSIISSTAAVNSKWHLTTDLDYVANIPRYTGNQYYGFRVKLPSGKVHYGWMLVENFNNSKGTILKIGIERVAGKAIAVGTI
jgi:hypothetical protein